MLPVVLTALGVGGATVIGSVLGFAFKKASHKFSDIVLSFAAGVMLAAAVIGLILPAVEGGDTTNFIVVLAGIFAGAVFLNMLDKFIPHLHKFAGVGEEAHPEQTERLNKIMLFVMAIAIHNLPEGIAAGVGMGGENITDGIAVAGGIALQNIPEGMVIIAPMLAAGMSKGRTFVAAMMTGAVEVLGTFIGFFAVSLSEALLPFALAFAGGTMLYVISDEMIPETHSHGSERGATFALIVGFCLMLATDFFIA